MIRNDTWEHIKGAWPLFPSTGWDHWLRHGSGLRPRECIVPEVPRTHHFDTKGTNVKAGNEIGRLLARMAESKLPAGELGDLSYLLHDSYEASLHEQVRGARTVENYGALERVPRGYLYVLPYIREEYSVIAKKLQISPAQPRTAHRGVIRARHPVHRAEVLLVDRRQGDGLLQDSDVWRPHLQRRIERAQPGESCDRACSQLRMRCDARELEFVNNCGTLQQYFPCENGCGHQVGKEIPCYVHDRKRDTRMQCLVTDEAIPACNAAIAVTTRLCVCIP